MDWRISPKKSKLFMIASLPALLLQLNLLCASFVHAAVEPLIIRGNRFFTQISGEEFIARSVSYQEWSSFGNFSNTVIDPLSESIKCAASVPLLLQLKINLVVVYAVRPEDDHEDCMSQFANAGIYVAIALGGTNQESSLGYRPTSWDTTLYSRFTNIVDKFQKFDNILGFMVSMGVEKRAPKALAYAKAAVRDTKAYIRAKNYRNIPVGYVGFDDLTSNTGKYLACQNNETGLDQKLSIDFYGINRAHVNCDQANMTRFNNDYKDFPIPIWYVQVICPETNKFGLVDTTVASGIITYTWFNNEHDQGLVEIKHGKLKLRSPYGLLVEQFASVIPSPAQISRYTPSVTAYTECSPVTIQPVNDIHNWYHEPQKISDAMPPKPYQRLCDCMMESITCFAPEGLLHENDSAMNKLPVCTQNETLCEGVLADGVNGTYGAFSICNATEQASWVFNQAYLVNQSLPDACKSIGGIQRQQEMPLTNECKILLDQAGPQGKGAITSTPSPEPMSESMSRAPMSSVLKVGLTIAISTALCFVIAFVLFLRYRRKRRAVKLAEEATFANIKPELPDNSIQRPEFPKHQVVAVERFELPTTDPERKELPSDWDKVEMAADELRHELSGGEVKIHEIEQPNSGVEPSTPYTVSELEGDSPTSERRIYSPVSARTVDKPPLPMNEMNPPSSSEDEKRKASLPADKRKETPG